MISRIWKGWTRVENADAYEELFRNRILPRVTAGVTGFRSVNLLRNDREGEVEFTTIFWFDSMESVIQFAGEDYSCAVVPEEVQALMLRYEPVVQHHNVVL